MKLVSRLYITEDDRAGRIVEVTGMATIGRASDSDIPVDEATVSHRHALLLPQPEGVVLIDLGSTNGSFVNGVQAPPDEMVWLADGDVITLGRVVLRYIAATSTLETNA
jgi:pSer/pThr/pTyr-binding forkhead associated (FHA) protein